MFKSSFWHIRIAAAISILILEVMLLSLMVDASKVPENGLLSLLLAQAGNLLRWIIVTVGLLVLLITNGFRQRIQILVSQYSPSAVFGVFLLHQGAFFILVSITHLVFRATGTESYFGYLWFFTVILTGLTWCLLIASAENWKSFVNREQVSIVRAAISGAIIVGLGFYFQRYWDSMTEFTFSATRVLLGIFYEDIITDIAQNKLGVDEFWVYIAPVCSGIEGVILAVSISAIYVYLSRAHLKFPYALTLLPLAAVISIALNIIRITLLIIIGAEVSPLLAVGSFHSVAGWISAVLVALLLIFVFSSWDWIQKQSFEEERSTRAQSDSALAQAILIPFVVYLGLTLIGTALPMRIDHFYPAKLIVTGAIFLYYWPVYRLYKPEQLQLSALIGVLVAIVWVVSSPDDALYNTATDTELIAMPFVLMIVWGILRLAGYWFLTPVMEELVFRSYLLHRLSGTTISNVSQPAFSLFALLVSSMLFGFLHHAWFAGTVSGLLFAGLRFHTRSLSNSIVSHIIANILVSTWAIYTQNWSLF